MKSNKFTYYFCLAILLVGTLGLRAQTMTQSSFPVAGDVFTLIDAKVAGFNPGLAGTGVTWNFSSLVPNDTIETDSFMAPLSTPYGALLSSVTVADHEISTVNGNVVTGHNQYIYYYNNTGAGAFQRVANVQPDTVIYSTAGNQFAYPFSYGSTSIGHYYAHYPSRGGSATETGTLYDTADGRGTLITPLGTSTNVLRAIGVRNELDTVTIPGLGTYPGTTTVVYYTWYQANSYFPIMWYTVTTVNFPSLAFLNLEFTTVGYRAGYPSAPSAPIAVNDTASVTEPGSVTIHVLANDINNNPPDTVCVTSVWGTPSGWETVQGCSDVVFQALDTTFSGLDTFYYRSCDTHYPTLCDTGMVVVNVLPAPVTLPFSAGYYATGGGCGADLLINASDSATSFTWYLSEAYPGSFDTAINNIDTLIPFDLGAQFQNATYYICLTARAGSSDTLQTCDTVQFICLGINQITASEYKIYPNPASDMIQLDLTHIDQATIASLSEIAVYDVLGEKLKTQPVSQTSISVGDLSDGVYMVGVIDKNQNKKILGKFEVLR